MGKAAVYGAAGVDPSWLVPVSLDVGCDTDRVVGAACSAVEPRPRWWVHWT